MKNGIFFDFFGFILFFKTGLFLVQCPIFPLFFQNIFLSRFYFLTQSSIFFLSTSTTGFGIVNNLNHFSFFLKNIRKFIFPFRRFCFVKFELWGLGLRFQSCLCMPNTLILSKLANNYSNFNNKPYFKLLFRYWRFRIGLSHQLCFFEMGSLKFILRNELSDFRRRMFLAISMSLPFLYFYCTLLRFSKSINMYKYRGLKYSSESIKLKVGKTVRL